MRNILAIAGVEMKGVGRNRVLFTLILLFLLSSVVSIYVGSSTIRTELAAYDLASNIQSGSAAAELPPPPEISPLAVMKNSIEYVLMIGALLAIFIGFDTVSEDYREKILHIVLSRSVYRDEYLTGKIAGGIFIILILHCASFLIEIAGLGWIGSSALSLNQIGAIAAFHGVAVLYMTLFYLLAFLFSIIFLKSLPAFLTAVSIWLASGYVIPEIGKSVKTFILTGDQLAGTVLTTAQSTPLSDSIESLSPAFHFRDLGAYFFSLSEAESGLFPLSSVLFLLILTVLTGAAAFLVFNAREVGSYE